MKKLLMVLPLLALLTSLVGCGPDTSHLPKTVPAEGIVLLDGSPVEMADVIFVADTGNNSTSAVTDANGRFQLNQFPEKEGAVPGSYKVGISKTLINAAGGDPEGGEVAVNLSNGLPAKYQDHTRSGLTCTIPESGDTDIKFELTSGKK